MGPGIIAAHAAMESLSRADQDARKMCLRHKHCHWVGQSAIINPAKGKEESFLVGTAATADKASIAATSVTATAVADKNCIRATADNDKPASLD